jgi:methionyl-tRNA formyltransferase
MLVGGTLGAWAIGAVPAADVGHVITDDAALAARAAARGFAVLDSLTNAGGRRAVSIHYQRIIAQATLDAYEGVYNLHPGLLPWGRGVYPVFWALWEGTPAGATLHEVVAALDAGPIVDQIEVPARPEDTGASLHARVQDAERVLLERWWPRIVAGDVPPGRPQIGAGSTHTRAEFHALKRSGWRALDAREFARLERCLSFPGYTGVERG